MMCHFGFFATEGVRREGCAESCRAQEPDEPIAGLLLDCLRASFKLSCALHWIQDEVSRMFESLKSVSTEIVEHKERTNATHNQLQAATKRLVASGQHRI
eukprot:5838941-Amphidinium_carterae.1